ncbi:MAG: terminase large subunit, partial [Lachnospiraceae bacterium]|nr:terminase large subunit [Lachnospiraceae bacterium]
DLTAAGFICEIDGILWTKAHFWLPKNRLEEATKRDGIPYEIYIRKGFLSLSGEEHVDYTDVLHWFMDLIRVYKIYPLMTGYDRWSAMELIQAMTRKHFKCDSVTQGFNLSNVADTFESLLREGKIRDMDDNDLLKIHLADSAMKMENAADKAHPRKMLVKISSKAHVDGTAMLLDAMAMRVFKWDELGSRLKNERRSRRTAEEKAPEE